MSTQAANLTKIKQDLMNVTTVIQSMNRRQIARLPADMRTALESATRATYAVMLAWHRQARSGMHK